MYIYRKSGRDCQIASARFPPDWDFRPPVRLRPAAYVGAEPREEEERGMKRVIRHTAFLNYTCRPQGCWNRSLSSVSIRIYFL